MMIINIVKALSELKGPYLIKWERCKKCYKFIIL